MMRNYDLENSRNIDFIKALCVLICVDKLMVFFCLYTVFSKSILEQIAKCKGNIYLICLITAFPFLYCIFFSSGTLFNIPKYWIWHKTNLYKLLHEYIFEHSDIVWIFL